MTKALLLLLVTLLLTACVTRVPVYSPRRTPTPEHRAATTAQECRGCHEMAGIKHHKADDDCLRCHTLCREC